MLCLMVLFSSSVFATHIVGGELELRYLGTATAYSHRISLNLYFDDVNGNPGADDASVVVSIFRKRDNTLIDNVELLRQGSTLIDYTVPACSLPSLRTRLIRYTTDIGFPPALFNDPAGYYIVWQRCCRNNIITNIRTPQQSGDAFYLEFPALPGSGTTGFNSSPVFNVVKGDYVCIDKPFIFDFSAKDPDGDSLSYAMVTPYNGFSSSTNPNPAQPGSTQLGIPVNPIYYAGPYPSIEWVRGYSAQNAIPGPKPLNVNPRTGLLSVTADQVGLFVFSVEVTEYRNHKAIGRVRRDFQLRVIDCPKNSPPKLLMKPDGQASFYKSGTVLTVNEKDLNCLNLYVTDADSNQRVNIINMSGSLPGLSITPGQLTTRSSKDTLQSKFCFGRCVAGDTGKPITLILRVTDEGCPQGLSDTLSIRLNIIADKNNKPVATTNLPGGQTTITVGQSLSFTAFGKDPDNDQITIQAVGRGFDIAKAGMVFTPKSGTGTVSNAFSWKPTCSQTTKPNYTVDFVVTDTRCGANLRDTVTVNLSAQGLPSQPPTIQTTLPKPIVTVVLPPGDSNPATISFDVLANDPDRDTLRLTATGRGFDLKQTGMTFTNKFGKPTLSSAFGWQPDCSLLKGRDSTTFVLDFVADDRACQPRHTDTTTVTVIVKQLPITFDVNIPNVFTPNGDGHNDFFTAPGLPPNNCDEQFVQAEVVNRWGRSVYTTRDRTFSWDGQDQPAGVYYYAIYYTRHTYKGTVTLIR